MVVNDSERPNLNVWWTAIDEVQRQASMLTGYLKSVLTRDLDAKL